MKHTKMTALLCTLALSSCISATAAPQAGSTPLDPYRAAVQKMKDLEKRKRRGEQSAPASAPAAAAPAGDVNYTDALLKGLDLTVADVQASVESGTFKNLSPRHRSRLSNSRPQNRNRQKSPNRKRNPNRFHRR